MAAIEKSISCVATVSVALELGVGCGDFGSLESDGVEMVIRFLSCTVSVSMEYDLRGNANVEPLEVVFVMMVDAMCLLCFIVISGTDRLKCVASNLSHSKQTSGRVS